MQYKTLDSLCKVASGGTPSRSKKEYWDGGDIPWIKIGNIKSKVVSNADEYITEAGLNNSSAKLFKKGTILYTIFATLGEVGILDFDACTNQAIAGISIEKPEEITTDYLYYYLKSKKAEVNQIGRGVAQNNINLSILRKFSIPLRDIEDQKTIVGFLNKVESIIEKQKRQLERLDELVKARFVEMFGSEKCAILQDLSDKITDGSHMPPKGVEKSDYLMLSSQNIFDEINCDSARFLSKEDFESENKRTDIMDGDVLITIVGTIGRTHVVRNGEKYVFQRSVGVIKPKRNKLNGVYLASYLQTDKAKAFLASGAHGSSQKGIYLQDLKKLPVPLASIELQNQFATFVSQVDKSKFAVQKSLEKTQLLFDSLMQEYFG